MDNMEKYGEGPETAPQMNEETLLDLANGESSASSDHFDGTAEFNPLDMVDLKIDVGEQKGGSGENSESFDSKDVNTVISPGLSETPHSYNGSQEMVMENITAAEDQFPEDLDAPKMEGNIDIDINTGSEHGISHKTVEESIEEISSPENDAMDPYQEVQNKESDEATPNVPETPDNYTNDAEDKNLTEKDMRELSEDEWKQEAEHLTVDKLKEPELPELESLQDKQPEEHQESEPISVNRDSTEFNEENPPEAGEYDVNLSTENSETLREHESEALVHESSESIGQMTSKMELTPKEYEGVEKIITDAEYHEHSHEPHAVEELKNNESVFQAEESRVEEEFPLETDQKSHHSDTSLQSDESLKYSDSGSLDTVSINPKEETPDDIEESADMKNIPESSAEETGSQKEEEFVESIESEKLPVESYQPQDIRMGTEKILNLEDSAEPLEIHYEDLETAQETPVVSTEGEQTLSKVHSQAYETCEAVHAASCDEFESESVDTNEAQATEHSIELQTAEVTTESVEIKTHEGPLEQLVETENGPQGETDLEPNEISCHRSDATEQAELILEGLIEKEQIENEIDDQLTRVNESVESEEVSHCKSSEGEVEAANEGYEQSEPSIEVVERIENDVFSQPTMIDEPVTKVELTANEIPNQDFADESSRVEQTEPIIEERIEGDEIENKVEVQPMEIKEPVSEVETTMPSVMNLSESPEEAGAEKEEITEVTESMMMQNGGEAEPANYHGEEQTISKIEAADKISPTIEDEKENEIPVNTNGEVNCKEPNISDDEMDFDTRYALFVGKVLPGHEIYYLPANKKKVTFRKGGTLDNRQTSSPLWDIALNGMQAKSATLGAPRRNRRRLQPKPTVNDDHLFPDSVTPSKVEKTLSEDDTSASNDGGEGGRYDVPFMDDDAFVPKKYRSVTTTVEDDSSSESDYSNERRDLIGSEHLAKMDETSPHVGKRNPHNTGGSRWSFSLSICGCFRRRR